MYNGFHYWKTKLEADQMHHFESSFINEHDTITHIKLKIYPDGGISRLRIWEL